MPKDELQRAVEKYIGENNTCALARGAGDFVRCTPIEYSYHDGKFRMFSEGGEKFIGVETYLFDCNEDLYGEYCKVDFKKFLRPEQNFSSLEALKAQLERDADKGREYFKQIR